MNRYTCGGTITGPNTRPKSDTEGIREEIIKAQRQAALDEFARAVSNEDVLSVLREWSVDNTSLNRAKARYAFAEQMMKAREV